MKSVSLLLTIVLLATSIDSYAQHQLRAARNKSTGIEEEASRAR